MDDQSYEDHTQAHGMKAYYIVGYFLLAAILVYPATKLHIGMAGIIYALTGAALILGLIIVAYRCIKRAIAAFHMSNGQWMRFLWGYTAPVAVVEEDAPTQILRTGQTFLQAGQACGGVGSGTSAAQTEWGSVVGRASPAQSDVSRMLTTVTKRLPTLGHDDDSLPDRIIESEGLFLSEMYQPSVNSMLGATLLFCGIRRAGKSNGMAVTIEELARYLVPMLICDTEDEYGGLVDRHYLPHGIMAGSLSLLDQAGEQLPHYVPIDLNGAFEFGKAILDGHLQVVLNLRSFSDDDEAALIICEIISGMHVWETGQPNAKRIPAMVFLDEANKWLPQHLGESMLSKDAQLLLHKTIFGTMVRRGGKQGLGLAVATQRISELDKRALQSIFKFLFMQTEQVDIERYTALGLDKDAIRTLSRGECFIFSPQAIGFRVHFRERTSPHMANTPGLNQLIAHRSRMQSLEAVTNRSYVSGRADRSVEPMPTTGTMKAVHTQKTRQSVKQDLALECYSQGHISVRALAAAMTASGTPTNESEAYRLLCQLDVAGRIKRVKREVTV